MKKKLDFDRIDEEIKTKTADDTDVDDVKAEFLKQLKAFLNKELLKLLSTILIVLITCLIYMIGIYFIHTTSDNIISDFKIVLGIIKDVTLLIIGSVFLGKRKKLN
jgi:hypothetical protein